MPILTNDLRSPDERRTDQLTILRRRPAPPRSAGRFFKIIADTATSIGAFDPAFDSDAETDGPASGSSIWRREFSRVRSASSTSIGLMIDEKRLSSFETKKTLINSEPKGIDRVASRKESDDSFVFEGFVRDRATSFYGKENDVVEVVGEGMSPISEKTLREELEEDYDMFYHPQGKENESSNKSNQTSSEPQPGNEEDVKREHDGVVAVVPTRNKTNECAQCDESEKAVQSLDSGAGSIEEGTTQSESLHTLKRFRLNDEPDRFTVSIISDDNSDDEQVEPISGMVGYQCGKIPLFVEEIGRVPRAVIIDGKVTRVRITPERGSFRQAVSKARRSSFGWGFKKKGWFGRRRSVGDRGELRRSGWWKMKRMLFRHGSEADAREL